MDRAAIVTAVSEYSKRLENDELDKDGKLLPFSPFCEKLIERTEELLEKSRKL